MMTRGRATRFLIGLTPGVAAVVTVDTVLYGAPWLSGYGAPDDLYAIRYAWTNLRQFASWLLETQTPLVLAAAIYFFVPQWIRPARIRYARLLLGGTAAAIGLSYLFYISFDAWWYLRFLLPMWPVLMIAVAASIDAVVRKIPAKAVVFPACVVALAVNGVRIAADRSTFTIGRGERRYIDIARFVAGHTEPGAVMISLQHSGTLRLYADRLTLRFDQLDPMWLDRAAAFLQANSRHPYVVLDGDEVALFQSRFGAVSQIGRLDWRPMAALESPRVVIYDAIDRSGTSPDASPPLAIAAAASRRIGWRCDMPGGR